MRIKDAVGIRVGIVGLGRVWVGIRVGESWGWGGLWLELGLREN